MSVRVRDLEIALVLAREMKAAAARSVDASLRLDQLQEVFGVERLDRAERARIQTALQMAGLEPFPSLLEADPSEPIRFGASKAAAGVAAADAAGAGGAGAELPEEPPAASEPPPTFPTVGEFARSKLGRSRRRRFGSRRGDHGEDDAPPPPPSPPAEEEWEGSNGHVAEADATEVHHDVLPEVEEPAEEHEEPVAEVAEEEPVPEEEPVAAEEPLAEVAEEPDHDEPGTAIHEEPDIEDGAEPFEPGHEDEREYIPLVPEQPVSYDPPAEPAPQPAAARAEDVVAALLPAVAIPVIVTSIAGWRFGLPFVALSVIATGWLLSRRKPAEGEKRGMLASVRRSPAAVTVLKTTVIVTLLSGAAAVVLAAVGKTSSSTSSDRTASPPAKKPLPKAASAAKPATPSKPKQHTRKKKPPTSTTSAGPPPDPATQGLVRVPPQSTTPSTATGPNGTGTQGAPGAQPGTGTPPSTAQPTP